ncbi:hypothetical protein [Methylomonas sp. DH-1]|uniref:hypothetical protein n=1 Tax=Methylomonas sp. (strain DH-1) TaxID=1727196 RepID=UPI0007C8B562|nr:hypothetical protein [Methylomonas sp. DH-1]ANE56546.1 hypothetical protein AYM39_16085 [Methylomonas sp. DH-1]
MTAALGVFHQPVKDPDTNKVLAIFEVKRDTSNFDMAVQQVFSYAKSMPDDVQAFIYSLNGELEEIYSINPKKNDVSQVYDLPAYDSLKSVKSSKNRESVGASYSRAKNSAKAWSTIVAGMSSSIAVAITIAMATSLFFDEKKALNNSELTERLFLLDTQKNHLENEIKSLKLELSSLDKSLQSVSTVPDGLGWKIEASKISADLTILSNKLIALETALTGW